MFVPQETGNEIMCGLSNVFSHFDKLCYPNIISPHQPKTALYCVRKRKVEGTVEHASSCVFLVLPDGVRRLLKTKISIFLR